MLFLISGANSSRVFNDADLLILERAFLKENYPSKVLVEALSKYIGVTKKQIKTWYANKRAKK